MKRILFFYQPWYLTSSYIYYARFARFARSARTSKVLGTLDTYKFLFIFFPICFQPVLSIFFFSSLISLKIAKATLILGMKVVELKSLMSKNRNGGFACQICSFKHKRINSMRRHLMTRHIKKNLKIRNF